MLEIAPDHSLDNLTFVAFDVETTGLSPISNALVELSGVKFNLKDDQTDTFSTLINPLCEITAQLTSIHGISNDMVADSPTYHTAVPAFLEWAGDAVFIAHNASFDVEFIRVNISKLGRACPTNFVIDTLVLSRELLRESPRHQLKTVVDFLGLPPGEYHRALSDSFHVRGIFMKLMEQENYKQWQNLLALGSVSGFSYDRFKDEIHASMPEAVKEIMAGIEAAINEKASVSITYNGAFKSKRTVQPVSVIHSRGNFYLNAFCQKVQAERIFRVDKIETLKIAKARIKSSVSV
ncbi:WYL domain-containing protein [bacterium]|nr:WYL domain-containing protein [bacterium]